MLHSPIGCDHPGAGRIVRMYLQPIVKSTRLLLRMDAISGVLPFPATGSQTRIRTRVDHRTTEEAALVRRVQARDETASRDLVERYQATLFAILLCILRN